MSTRRPVLAPRFAANLAAALTEITGRPWADTTIAGLDVSEVAHLHDDRGVGFRVEISPSKKAHEAPRYSMHWRMQGEQGSPAFNDMHERMRAYTYDKGAGFGSMTTSADKTIPTVAKEIARRLLPEIEAHQIRAVEAYKATEARKASDAAIARELLEPRGLRVWINENGAKEPTFDGKAGPSRVSGRVYQGETTIKAEGLTPEQAAAVLSLLSSFPTA